MLSIRGEGPAHINKCASESTQQYHKKTLKILSNCMFLTAVNHKSQSLRKSIEYYESNKLNNEHGLMLYLPRV